ncbi:MAG: TonB-dependent receptor plug domain-containing protein [Opitutaceae bacterium]
MPLPELSLHQLEERRREIDGQLKTIATYSLGSGLGAIGYRSHSHETEDHAEWIEVDLGAAVPLDEIVVVPTIRRDPASGFQADGFPKAWRVRAGTGSDRDGQIIAEFSWQSGLLPRIAPVVIPCGSRRVSWIRIEALTLSRRAFDGRYVFQLAEILAFSGRENVALRKPVKSSAGSLPSVVPGWAEAYATDGVLPYLMAAADGKGSVAYLSQLELGNAPAITIDLGSVHRVNQLHLHAVDQSDTVPQAFAGDFGIPEVLRVDGACSPDFSDAKILFEATRPSTITSPIFTADWACVMHRPPSTKPISWACSRPGSPSKHPTTLKGSTAGPTGPRGTRRSGKRGRRFRLSLIARFSPPRVHGMVPFASSWHTSRDRTSLPYPSLTATPQATASPPGCHFIPLVPTLDHAFRGFVSPRRRCTRPPADQIQTMKNPTLIAVLSASLLAAADVHGQTTAMPAPPANDTVVLSPFTVGSEKDNGYAATETLAGTRMRTDLRDVGASLTVLTPQFLEDLAVNSFEQALLYTPSVDAVEGDNTDANRASGTQMRFGTGQSYSIRGFVTNAGNQSISHDFFSALEPTDNYNLERLTLALGPNALLIGVGNPQGVAVTTTKRAQLQRMKTALQLQTDRWGSQRVAIDHNQPLIRDTLAFRLNLLHDKSREFRRFEGKDQERVTLGVTAQPYENTKLTLNHESYSLGTNASSQMWGFNSGALRWAAAGKPTIEFLPNGQTWTATRAYVDAKGNRIPVAPGVTNASGFVGSKNDFDPKNAVAQITGQTPTWIVGLNLANPMVNTRYQGQLQVATFGGQASANYQSQDPWAMLGLSKDANLNGGTWADPSSKQHGRWTQLLVEQKLATGLYLELAGNIAKYHQSLDPNNFTSITIDPNRYLPDGSLNPGYLVPYAENAQMQFRPVRNQSNEYRATLSYELDLTQRNRWLGKHSFAGLYQFSRSDASQDLTRIFNLATIGRTGWSGDAVNATNVIRTRAYFVEGKAPVMPDSNQLFNNRVLLSSYPTLLGASATERAPINLSRQSFLGAIKNRFEDKSTSLGWQARWLKERLITVAGYRKDDTRSYAATATREVALAAVPGSATDPLRRYYTLADDLPFDTNPAIVANGISRTYGAVLHALPWLSLTYNRSSNFLPVSNASWKNALGESAPNSAGQTQEYGARFSLFKDKLNIGLTKFETSADDQARNANGSVTPLRNILTRLRTNYKDTGDSHFTGLAEQNFYPVDTGNVSDTWSYKADGYEMNVVYNPSRDWRMALSGSRNTNTLGTHLLALGRYLSTDSQYQGLGTWRKFATELNQVAAGQRSALFDLDPASSTARAQATADALYLTQQTDTQEKGYLDDQALSGITTARNGKYAFNGLVTRVFHEGRLKGWSVGGNFRWRSANTVGYARFPDTAGAPTGILNVAQPILGKEFWDIGAMVSYQCRLSGRFNLRVQLNVQNLPDWQSPRLVKSDYDSQGTYGPSTNVVPVLWELRRPRNFILTTALEF